jgi:PKD repeat protein
MIDVPNQDSYYGIYGLVNEPIEFTGNAAGEHPPFIYHWDFGDDTTSEEQNPSHTYSESSEYKVKLTVTDDKGVSFYDLKTVYIQETNQPPDQPMLMGFPIAKAGEYAWHSITLSDPDESILYIYEEFFGDESGTWWGPYLPGETIYIRSLNRVEMGIYDVKVKAKDPYGAESDWATLKVFVPKSKSISDFNPWFSRLIKHFPILKLII